MVDIDLFKRVNDKYGHIVGDQVIRDVTLTLKEQIRRNDFAGRYGGEEFIVMLPETPLEKALLLAEKLRKQVSHLTVTSEGNTLSGITISLGAAEYIKDESIDDFIDRSDKGLYMAKDAGRNRVAHIS
jgi:diguanylate cyclase